MKLRDLGKTGIKVSEVGFGAWGIGGRTAGETSYGDTDDATSEIALANAFESGINFFRNMMYLAKLSMICVSFDANHEDATNTKRITCSLPWFENDCP